MAKVQKYKARRDEHLGEERALRKKRHHHAFPDYNSPLNYERRKEARDFEMLSEDRSACANLPQDVKYHEWPNPRHYSESDIDDSISGVNRQISDDGAQMARHRSKSKY